MRKLLALFALFVVIALAGGLGARTSDKGLSVPIISNEQTAGTVNHQAESFIATTDDENCSNEFCCSSPRCHNSCCAGALLTPALIIMDGVPDHSTLLPLPQGLRTFAISYSIIHPPRA